MEFFRRPSPAVCTLGILPGTFNPPTRAHLALANAALKYVDEVLFVLPRLFPHKSYEGATFEERIGLLLEATQPEPRFSVASTTSGLFIDIAQECRAVYGTGIRLVFLCGADAADRIVSWDYGSPAAFQEMMEVFELLVAARGTDYSAPVEYRHRIRSLILDTAYDEISATEVRSRIASGERWQHLVPEVIVPRVEGIYWKGER
jgi:nicotinate-nucleotide adenylyltransferase